MAQLQTGELGETSQLPSPRRSNNISNYLLDHGAGCMSIFFAKSTNWRQRRGWDVIVENGYVLSKCPELIYCISNSILPFVTWDIFVMYCWNCCNYLQEPEGWKLVTGSFSLTEKTNKHRRNVAKWHLVLEVSLL